MPENNKIDKILKGRDVIMAKKSKKKEVVEEPTPELVEEPVAPEVPVVEEVPEVSKPKYMVNCHRCGAALHVDIGNMVYMCPVCNNLFRVRKCEKLVKDVTRVVVAEAYVNVHKGKDEV